MTTNEALTGPVSKDESDLPDVSTIPDQAKQVLELVGLGWTYEQIGKLTKSSKQNIGNIVTKYDPQGHYRSLSKLEKLELRARGFERLSDRALLEVTDQKLKATSAAQLTTISAICTDKALRLREQQAPEDTRDSAEILVAIRARLSK